MIRKRGTVREHITVKPKVFRKSWTMEEACELIVQKWQEAAQLSAQQTIHSNRMRAD